MKKRYDFEEDRPSALRAALPGLILGALLLLPFLGKAFTIDDPLFLKEAQHLLEDPLHPTAMAVVWSDRPERMSKIMPSGPVMAWLLLPSILLDGSEWAAHGVVLVLLSMAVVATCSLAVRWGSDGRGARNAGLLLASTPAVLTLAGTAMPDVPAMAFGVWGVERLVAWHDERRWHQGTMAAILLALAMLSRSHLVLLVGVGAIATAAPRRLATWAPLAAALAVAGSVVLATHDPLGHSADLATAAARFSSTQLIPRNAVAFLAHWALVLPLAIPWTLLAPARIFSRPVFYAGAAAGFAAALQFGQGVQVAIVALATGLGAASLWHVVAEAIGQRDRDRIALGAWLLVAAPVVFYLHLPSKYLVASAPAVAIVISRALEQASGIRVRTVLSLTLAAGAVLGVTMLRADAVFAELGRRAADELIAPEVASGRVVWFVGHWGFQWYAEKAGGKPLTLTPPRPVPGDHVIAARHSGGELLGPLVKKRTRLRSTPEEPRGGRLMDAKLGAGFYSNSFGYLPWTWGRSAVDRYETWLVE